MFEDDQSSNHNTQHLLINVEKYDTGTNRKSYKNQEPIILKRFTPAKQLYLLGIF